MFGSFINDRYPPVGGFQMVGEVIRHHGSAVPAPSITSLFILLLARFFIAGVKLQRIAEQNHESH